jgi:Na+-driven multidrug efflux pump
MSQSRATSLADIANTTTLILLAMMIATTTNTGSRAGQQNCKDHENIAADTIASEILGGGC